MTSNHGRTPAGVPTGGQFAAEPRRASDLAQVDLLVADEEADLNDEEDNCSHCGMSLDDNEGYDGLCGNCADLAEDHNDGNHKDAPDENCPECD